MYTFTVIMLFNLFGVHYLGVMWGGGAKLLAGLCIIIYFISPLNKFINMPLVLEKLFIKNILFNPHFTHLIFT